MNNLDSRSPHWLTDDEPLPQEVRDALRLADQEDGQADQIARLEARLAPLFLAPSPEATSSNAGSPAEPTGSSLWSAGTLFGASAALLGIAALVWPQREYALRSMPGMVATYQAEAEMPTRTLARVELAAAETHEATEAPAVADEVDTREPSESVQRPTARARKAQKAEASAAQDTLALEARLLGAARKALPDSPDAALALTDRHRARFPSGVLVEEREAIAIRAMHQAGMLEGARARYARFIARFPDSPHARNLDVLLSARGVSR